jgi:hypothetical protein
MTTESPSRESRERGPSTALILEFFIAGIIGLIGWYVVNLIAGFLPAKTPWTFVLIPYSVLVVAIFFLVLGTLGIIIRLRR